MDICYEIFFYFAKHKDKSIKNNLEKLNCKNLSIAFQLNIPVVDDVIKIAAYPFSLKFWAGGKINRPGQLTPYPLSIRNPTEHLK